MRLRLEIVPETEREASLMKQLIDFEPYYDAVADFRITEVGGD